MPDPFAHGTPDGDHHTWISPASAACPHCECCTAALCRRAVDKRSACHHEGDASSFDLATCPCWRRGTPGHLAYTVATEGPDA